MVTYIVFNNINLADFGTPEAEEKFRKKVIDWYVREALQKAAKKMMRGIILRHAGFGHD